MSMTLEVIVTKPFTICAFLLALIFLTSCSDSKTSQSTAFLGVLFINDNSALDPTSDAERKRIAKLEELFTKRLAESGRYRFVDVPADFKARIAKNQPVGECGGCEIEYGEELGAQKIAWIRVQKVSNLILNMNVYMADVKAKKMTFVRSVDIRGNSDLSWMKSLEWLLKNYLLKDAKK